MKVRKISIALSAAATMFAQTVPSPAIEKINWQAPAGLELPRLNEIHLDGAVLGFAVLLAVATSVVFGLAPLSIVLWRRVINREPCAFAPRRSWLSGGESTHDAGHAAAGAPGRKRV